jgi:glutamine amidotransferase
VNATIFDYGAGNLHSIAKALGTAGVRATIESDPLRALDTGLLVLPGVGAFGAACERLAPAREALRGALDDGLPCLGICLGMQLLFETSEEDEGLGLGFVPGRVRRVRAARVPQMGWNTIESDDPLFARAGMAIAYFANSFVCEPREDAGVIAWSEHQGDRFAAAIRHRNTLGVQFHPEKSSSAGLALIAGFVAEAAEVEA